MLGSIWFNHAQVYLIQLLINLQYIPTNINYSIGEVVMPSIIKYVFTNQDNNIKHILMRDNSNMVWKMSTCLKLPFTLSILWTISYEVVKVPSSIYDVIPGHNKYSPLNNGPIQHFTMLWGWTSQKLPRSIGGAILGLNLTTKVFVYRSLVNPDKYPNDIMYNTREEAASYMARDNLGIKG